MLGKSEGSAERPFLYGKGHPSDIKSYRIYHEPPLNISPILLSTNIGRLS